MAARTLSHSRARPSTFQQFWSLPISRLGTSSLLRECLDSPGGFRKAHMRICGFVCAVVSEPPGGHVNPVRGAVCCRWRAGRRGNRTPVRGRPPGLVSAPRRSRTAGGGCGSFVRRTSACGCSACGPGVRRTCTGGGGRAVGAPPAAAEAAEAPCARAARLRGIRRGRNTGLRRLPSNPRPRARVSPRRPLRLAPRRHGRKRVPPTARPHIATRLHVNDCLFKSIDPGEVQPDGRREAFPRTGGAARGGADGGTRRGRGRVSPQPGGEGRYSDRAIRARDRASSARGAAPPSAVAGGAASPGRLPTVPVRRRQGAKPTCLTRRDPP